jgi:phage FluMu gp28-like protein
MTTATKRKAKSAPNNAGITLYPYQERWVRDKSRFKLAVKATQIGYSFAAALEAVLDCLEHRTLWIVLSRGERQSEEFMQKVRQHTEAMRIVGSKFDTSFFEQAEIRQHEIQFPNGSRIIGLPANPDTARGYTGNMILDEFAFHQQDRDIWAAAFGRISRGDLKLRVISTPNGQRGKYYELAKELGLTNGPSSGFGLGPGRAGGTRDSGFAEHSSPQSRTPNSESRSPWSGHWCDVHAAVKQGCPMDVEPLRQAMGDPERWQQEYECVFLSASDQYIPLDLIVECEHPQASVSLPSHWQICDGERFEDRECYFGYDVARVHDLAVLAVVEKVGDVLWTRALIEMPAMKFSGQEKILSDVIPLCRRGAIDATGLGSEMAERLAASFPGKVEPVSFTAGRKQEMAVRMKRHFEERTVRIPDHRGLRRDLTAVKRIITSAGNIRFDAERTEEGHADRFWALALALHAAERGTHVAAASDGWESKREWYRHEPTTSIYEPDPISSAELADEFLVFSAPVLQAHRGGFQWA